MDKLQHPSAVNGLFVDADPVAQTDATVIPLAHMNAVLLELINLIEGAGLVPNANDLTQVLEAVRSLGASTATPNLAINGAFRVWQRGFDFDIAAAPKYTADRWEAAGDSVGGTGTCNVSRQVFTHGQADVPGAEYFLRYEQEIAPNGGGGFLRTKLEQFLETSDRTVTVSFWARASVASTISVGTAQVHNSGEVAQTPEDVTLSTSWQRYSVSIDLPSVLGLSYTPIAHLRVAFAMPTAAGTIVEIAQVQVEAAAEATGFQRRPLALEQALCRRYFEKSIPMDFTSTTTRLGCAIEFIDGDTLSSLSRAFRTPKRALPSITWLTPGGDGGRVLWDTGGTGLQRTVSQVVYTSKDSTGYPVLTQPVDTSAPVVASWIADAEL